MHRKLPHETDQKFLVFAATGTDLIFNRGIELPGFASFPLNEDPAAQPVIVDQMRDLVKTAQDAGMGADLEVGPQAIYPAFGDIDGEPADFLGGEPVRPARHAGKAVRDVLA